MKISVARSHEDYRTVELGQTLERSLASSVQSDCLGKSGSEVDGLLVMQCSTIQ